MRTLFGRIIVTLLLAFPEAVSVSAQDNKYIAQTRRLDNFTAIELTTVGNLYFTQGDTPSIRIEGRRRDVYRIATRVKNGRLYISKADQTGEKRAKRKGLNFYITAPMLTAVKIMGIGSFTCEETLRVGDIDFTVDGDGDVRLSDLHCGLLNLYLYDSGMAYINVQAEHIRASINGVSGFVLKGKTCTLRCVQGGRGVMNAEGMVTTCD